MNFSGKKKGFTLIEMLIVIVIIGVLASALIPRLGSARGKANDVARKADLQQAATAIITYQIDKNKFPDGPKSFTDAGFQQDLRDGGMASIPEGDSTEWTGMNNTNTSGYMYYPMKKNGSPKNGFILVAKAETEGGANFVFCDASKISGDGKDDVEGVELCTISRSDGEDFTCGDCIYTGDKSQLRYIYKY